MLPGPQCTILQRVSIPRRMRSSCGFLRYAKRSCTEVQSELYVALDEEYIAPSEFEDVYEQAIRIPPRRDCPWLYQLPEQIRRTKDLNNREPLNRERKNLCGYQMSIS